MLGMLHTTSRSALFILLPALACTYSASISWAGDSHIRLVADAFGTVPGATDASGWQFFEPPVINDSGDVAFAAALRLPAGSSSIDSGIWSEAGGSGLKLVAREGDQAPAVADGHRFKAMNARPFLFNSDGALTFRRGLSGAGVNFANDAAYWTYLSDGTVRLVAREDELAPVTPAGIKFGILEEPVMNHAGEVAFKAWLNGPGVDSSNIFGVFSEAGGGGSGLVARAGQSAEGTPAGVVFQEPFDPLIDDLGGTAFVSTLAGTGIVTENDHGIWLHKAASSLRLVTREGDHAPGFAPAVSFGEISPTSLRLNGNGQLAFVASLTGFTAPDPLTRQSLWTGTYEEQVRFVAGEGDPGAGLDAGELLGIIFSPAISDSGDVVFGSLITGTEVSVQNDKAIWRSDANGELQLIAREGQAVPGLGNEWQYSGLLSHIANSAGRVAFKASVTDGQSSRLGIWAENTAGQLALVALTGAEIDVGSGGAEDLRTVSTLFFPAGAGFSSRLPGSFNTPGQVVFDARFTNGSGAILVSNAATVPEPTSLWLLVLALSIVSHRLRATLRV